MKTCAQCKNPKACMAMGKCIIKESKTGGVQQSTMGVDPVYKSAGGTIYNNR